MDQRIRNPRNALGRRAFLGATAAAGAGLCFPWLETFSSRVGAQPALPKRMIVIMVGHSPQAGESRPEWAPTTAGPLTTLPEMLDPLTPFRDRLLLVSGIDNLLNRILITNGHNASARTLKTCVPHKAALAPDGSLRPDAGELTWQDDASGPSFDYYLANLFGQSPLSVRVGMLANDDRRTYRLDASVDVGEPDPRAAFASVFGQAMGGTGSTAPKTPLEQLRSARARILDTVRLNYQRVASTVSAADRIRLEEHASLIENLVAELGRTVEIVCSDPQLQTDPSLGSAFEDPDGRNDDAITRTMHNLVATTLSCTNKRIVSLHMGNATAMKFPWLNGGSDLFSYGWHQVIHREVGTDAERMVANRWYFTMLADLMTRLQSIPDGTGTMLDSTLIVWTSSLANNWHSTDSLPFVIVTPPGGPLKTGQHVMLSGSKRRSLADMWVTLMNVMGANESSFGWNVGVEPEQLRPFNMGPIAELLS